MPRTSKPRSVLLVGYLERASAPSRSDRCERLWACPTSSIFDILNRIHEAPRDSRKIQEGVNMSGVRVLVGTRKGAFILTSDAKRERWDISGPHFAGWEIYHLKGSPADPNRLYGSQ